MWCFETKDFMWQFGFFVVNQAMLRPSYHLLISVTELLTFKYFLIQYLDYNEYSIPTFMNYLKPYRHLEKCGKYCCYIDWEILIFRFDFISDNSATYSGSSKLNDIFILTSFSVKIFSKDVGNIKWTVPKITLTSI